MWRGNGSDLCMGRHAEYHSARLSVLLLPPCQPGFITQTILVRLYFGPVFRGFNSQCSLPWTVLSGDRKFMGSSRSKKPLCGVLSLPTIQCIRCVTRWWVSVNNNQVGKEDRITLQTSVSFTISIWNQPGKAIWSLIDSQLVNLSLNKDIPFQCLIFRHRGNHTLYLEASLDYRIMTSLWEKMCYTCGIHAWHTMSLLLLLSSWAIMGSSTAYCTASSTCSSMNCRMKHRPAMPIASHLSKLARHHRAFSWRSEKSCASGK